MNFRLSWECMSSILVDNSPYQHQHQHISHNSPTCRRIHSHQQSQRLLEVSRQSKETHPPAQKPMLEELIKIEFSPLHQFRQRSSCLQEPHRICSRGHNPGRKQGRVGQQLLRCLEMSSLCHNHPSSELFH